MSQWAATLEPLDDNVNCTREWLTAEYRESGDQRAANGGLFMCSRRGDTNMRCSSLPSAALCFLAWPLGPTQKSLQSHASPLPHTHTIPIIPIISDFLSQQAESRTAKWNIVRYLGHLVRSVLRLIRIEMSAP